MIHSDYKKMFNGIIDNNLTQIHNLDEIEGLEEGSMNDKTRRKLERMYKGIRETINTNLPMRPNEILVLGTGANLSLITLKNSLARIQKTIAFYEETLIPAFEAIKAAEPQGSDELIRVFEEKFSQPIDKITNV